MSTTGESVLHRRLKDYAREILEGMGFQTSEITEEYGIVINNTKYIVDVAGIAQEKKIAFECNYKHYAERTKLDVLGIYFTEVQELDLFDLVKYLEYKIKELQTQLYHADLVRKQIEAKVDHKDKELEDLRSVVETQSRISITDRGTLLTSVDLGVELYALIQDYQLKYVQAFDKSISKSSIIRAAIEKYLKSGGKVADTPIML